MEQNQDDKSQNMTNNTDLANNVDELKKKIEDIMGSKSSSMMPKEDGEIICAVLASFFTNNIDYSNIVDDEFKNKITTQISSVIICDVFSKLVMFYKNLDIDFPMSQGTIEETINDTLGVSNSIKIKEDPELRSINFDLDDPRIIAILRELGFKDEYLNSIKANGNEIDWNNIPDYSQKILFCIFSIIKDANHFCSLEDFPKKYKRDLRELLNKGIGKLDKIQITSMFGSGIRIPTKAKIKLFILKWLFGIKDWISTWKKSKEERIYNRYIFSFFWDTMGTLVIREKHYFWPVYEDKDIDSLIQNIDKYLRLAKPLAELFSVEFPKLLGKLKLSWGQSTDLLRLAKEYVESHQRSYAEMKSQWEKECEEEQFSILSLISSELLLWYLIDNPQSDYATDKLMNILYAVAYDEKYRYKLIDFLASEIPNKTELNMKQYVNSIEFVKIRETFRSAYNESCRRAGRPDFFLEGETLVQFIKNPNVKSDDYLDLTVSCLVDNFHIKSPQTDEDWAKYFKGFENLLTGLIEKEFIAQEASAVDFIFYFTGRGGKNDKRSRIIWKGPKNVFCYLIYQMCTFDKKAGERSDMPGKCLNFFYVVGLDNNHLSHFAKALREQMKTLIDELITNSFKELIIKDTK